MYIICSITSETLLWILCSCRSNDIQAILDLLGFGFSQTSAIKQERFQNRIAQMFQIGYILDTYLDGLKDLRSVKDFNDMTLAGEDGKKKGRETKGNHDLTKMRLSKQFF